MKKFLFYFIWLLVLSIGPITILKVTPLDFALSTPVLTINFIQRIVALLAFSMLFWQIILGSFMDKWIEKLGGWVFKFHVLEGAVIYTFGRVGFWLITLAVLAAKLRTQPWLRVHWRKFHILNYLAFIFISIHSRFTGTDTLTPPFVWFWWIATIVIIGIVIYNIYKNL